MIYLDNKEVTDPRQNLALEEFALRNLSPEQDYLLFYINEPSVIIGRHQNTIEEINTDFINRNSIHVVRRISGGGAVYHDTGNLNFSFITRFQKSKFNNYREFTAPVIKTLRSIGVNAELNGRNDIVVGDRKISGNAQFTSRDRMLSHGTLLVNSNLEDVVQALKVRPGKIESKGIKSVRSRVANISEFTEQPLDAAQLRRFILSGIFGGSGQVPAYDFSSSEQQEIRKLYEEKYCSWHWNYGESPKFNVQYSARFDFGEIDVRLFVEKGVIENIKFLGDFMGRAEVSELEKLLTNIRYEKKDLWKALKNVDLTQYFGEISSRELIELLY